MNLICTALLAHSRACSLFRSGNKAFHHRDHLFCFAKNLIWVISLTRDRARQCQIIDVERAAV